MNLITQFFNYFITDEIGDISIPRFIIFVICLAVLILTTFSIFINFFDWIKTIYSYSKLGWFQFSYPDYEEKIIRMKYEVYIVGYPSGEIIYVDRSLLKKLKRKKLIKWSNAIGYYAFSDQHLEKIKLMKEMMQPFEYYPITRPSTYYDECV